MNERITNCLLVEARLSGYDAPPNELPRSVIARMRYRDVQEIPNIGPSSMKVIVDWLAEEGLEMVGTPHLAPKPPRPPTPARIKAAVAMLEGVGYKVVAINA
jgi:hypothetical protein